MSSRKPILKVASSSRKPMLKITAGQEPSVSKSRLLFSKIKKIHASKKLEQKKTRAT
jgi:hypothetical protein